MKIKRPFRKIVSALLVFVMVFTLMSFHAFAANPGREADTIFFATDRHEESSKLNSLLKAMAYTPGLVVLGGDHVNNTNRGSLSSITSEIQSVYPGVQTFYTYAAHDPNVSADNSNPYAFARTGEVYEGEDYYVYGVDQDHMQSASNAATASSAFKTWAASADASKVIFVMCHMPIHSRRGDNAGGATWMNALNEVGKTHDVVFLWGHNHTGENSTDTSVYFVNVGGRLTPQGGSTGTINFTYMNAGYIKNGYGSMVVVNSDNVAVTRYSTSGSATATYSIQRRFAVSHTWEVIESVAATCTQDGYQTVYCADCGETKTTAIAATGHNYSSAVVENCTGSYTVYTCKTCGASYSEQNATETTYDKVSSLVEGESYVIVASNYALTYGSSVGKTSVSVSNNSITSNVSDAMIWTYENGKLRNGSSYINLANGSSSSRKSISFSTSGASVSYSSNKLKIGSYYLYYSSNSSWSARSSGSTVTLYQVNEGYAVTGEHTYESVTVAPTCTTDGSITYTCAACGDTYIEVIASNGTHNYETVTVDATCTTAGSVTTTCTACGETTTEEIAALGHSYEAVVTAPTCTEAGYTTYTCACGDFYVADEVAALGHSHEAIVTEATCTEAGYTTYTCVCGDSYVTGEIAALGHDFVSVTVDATCTEKGSVTTTCTICGETTVEEIAALGHNGETVTVNATCTEKGSVTTTCTICGETTVEEIAALGHNYETVTVDATCTTAGSVTTTCTVCGETTVEEISALGHTHEAVVTAPTCTEAGYTTYTCACGDFYVADEVAALGHSYNAVVTAPTCTEAGYTTYICACGDSYVADEVAALGHTHEAVVTAPTCTESGYTTYSCACGDSYVADEVAALGHSYNAVVTAPTCTEAGYTTYICVCGASYTADQVAAIGHSYSTEIVGNNLVYTCDNCGHSYSESLEVAHSYDKVTAFTSGENYVITLYSGGKYYALSHKNNKLSAVKVTVSKNEITSEVTEELLWNYNNKKLSYEDDNGTVYYLYSGSTRPGSSSLSLSTNKSSYITISRNSLKVGSNYLRYSNGNIKTDRSATTCYLFMEN